MIKKERNYGDMYVVIYIYRNNFIIKEGERGGGGRGRNLYVYLLGVMDSNFYITFRLYIYIYQPHNNDMYVHVI